MSPKQKKPFQADGRTSIAYSPLTASTVEPLQQLQQLPKPPLQQQNLSCYSKVTSWLNSTAGCCSSSSNAATVTRPSAARSAAARTVGGPLLARASSLLWYMGLGGLLYPRSDHVTSTVTRVAAAAAAPRAQLQPLVQPGPNFTTNAFPASHPLTAQQLEQSAGISTSAAAQAPSAVQAVAKGEPACLDVAMTS